ncbi:MAG TPA: hypothetical protein VLX11_07770, partial [Candidatus Acidoferrales bacterium]|nr:hypothetical protein [Candidatus Acidoferrales bacterium]
TKYKVSDDVVTEAAATFRCSRCKHTFELEIPELSEPFNPEEPVSRVDGDKERELSFTFPPRETKDAPHRPEEKITDSVVHEGSKDKPDLPDDWSINVKDAKGQEEFTLKDFYPEIRQASDFAASELEEKDPSLPDAALASSREGAANVYAMTPHRDQRASIVPFLTLFGLLVLFYSFATAYNQVHPSASEDIVGKIPVVGSLVVKNDHLKNNVLLQSLQPSYQTIQGNREVFIITGSALNQNPTVIREVRLLGRLYNQEGKEIERQTIWIGNAISPKIVRGMTVQDISDLQRLKPLKSFEIPPGDSVPFTIVFLRPTKAAKDFRFEVLSAEGEA